MTLPDSYRWIVLTMFSSCTFTNALLWVTYSPINASFAALYDIDPVDVDWCSSVFMLAYIPFFYPASWTFSTYGLRTGILLSAVLDAVGTWLRYVFGRGPSGFVGAIVGQSLAAIAQPLVLACPSALAARWFPPHERSTACSIGVIANQLGIAVGFYLGPALVAGPADIPAFLLLEALLCTVVAAVVAWKFPADGDAPSPLALDDTASGVARLRISSLAGAGAGAGSDVSAFRGGNAPVQYAIVDAAASIVDAAASTPANLAAAAASSPSSSVSSGSFGVQLHALLQHRGFLWLLLSYGGVIGASNAIVTFLPRLLAPAYPTYSGTQPSGFLCPSHVSAWDLIFFCSPPLFFPCFDTLVLPAVP